MRILVETSGGGGVVLLILGALALSHGDGLSAAATAVLIALIVAAVAAVVVVAVLLLRRARPPQAPAALAPRVLRAEVMPDAVRPALAPPQVRLDPDQLAELAEILRRHERPE